MLHYILLFRNPDRQRQQNSPSSGPNNKQTQRNKPELTHLHRIHQFLIPSSISSTLPPRLNEKRSTRRREARFSIMCYIVYTIHVCNHWIPQPQPNNGPILRICEEAEKLRLGHPCPETQREHKVMNRSQGMCTGCMWKKVSK